MLDRSALLHSKPGRRAEATLDGQYFREAVRLAGGLPSSRGSDDEKIKNVVVMVVVVAVVVIVVVVIVVDILFFVDTSTMAFSGALLGRSWVILHLSWVFLGLLFGRLRPDWKGAKNILSYCRVYPSIACESIARHSAAQRSIGQRSLT